MAQTQNRRRVYSFLENLAAVTNVSSSQARIRLARKLSNRAKLVKRRNNIRQKLRALAKSLETVEAEIEIADQEIRHLEIAVEEGSDGEED